MPKPSVPYVVCIWLDAWKDMDDTSIVGEAHERHRAAVLETPGWLVYDNEDGVSIFHEYSAEDGSFRGRSFIPRGMIKTIVPVTLARKRSSKGRAKTTNTVPTKLPAPPADPEQR